MSSFIVLPVGRLFAAVRRENNRADHQGRRVVREPGADQLGEHREVGERHPGGEHQDVHDVVDHLRGAVTVVPQEDDSVDVEDREDLRER
mgnify:CR=1 FL=1